MLAFAGSASSVDYVHVVSGWVYKNAFFIWLKCYYHKHISHPLPLFFCHALGGGINVRSEYGTFRGLHE